jgi:hypothetical protein
MPNSYIVMGILAVVSIILSLKWMKNANRKENLYRGTEESAEWARKWNKQREKENKEVQKQWCDGGCKECAADKCFFREV